MRAFRLSESQCHALDDKSFKEDPDFWANLLPAPILADLKIREAEARKDAGQAKDADDERHPISEAALRALIEAYPEVIPWKDLPEFSPAATTPAVLGREFDGIDLLLLEWWLEAGTPDDLRARLVIVETKLRENREIQHKVFGQILEYASKLARDPDLLRNLQEFSKDAKALPVGEGRASEALKKAVAAARAGDIRLLIVANQIPVELARAIAFVPKLFISALGLKVATDNASPRTDVVLSSAVVSGGEFKASIEFLDALETPSFVKVKRYSDARVETSVVAAEAFVPGGSKLATTEAWDPDEARAAIKAELPSAAHARLDSLWNRLTQLCGSKPEGGRGGKASATFCLLAHGRRIAILTIYARKKGPLQLRLGNMLERGVPQAVRTQYVHGLREFKIGLERFGDDEIEGSPHVEILPVLVDEPRLEKFFEVLSGVIRAIKQGPLDEVVE